MLTALLIGMHVLSLFGEFLIGDLYQITKLNTSQ